MTLEFWRNLSIVWIGLHLFILTAIPLVMAFFAVRGMNWVLKQAAVGFHSAQKLSRRTRQRTENMADRVAAPFIRIRSKATGTRAAAAHLLARSPQDAP